MRKSEQSELPSDAQLDPVADLVAVVMLHRDRRDSPVGAVEHLRTTDGRLSYGPFSHVV